MLNDDDYSAALPIGIVVVAATVLLCACVGCHETALRAWKLCLGQRSDNTTSAAPSTLPPHLVAGSDASTHALEMAEVPTGPRVLIGDDEKGLREGNLKFGEDTISNLPASSIVTVAGATDGPSLSGMPPVPENQLEAVVVKGGGGGARNGNYAGVPPTTGDSLDLWASLSPDKKGLVNGLSGKEGEVSGTMSGDMNAQAGEPIAILGGEGADTALPVSPGPHGPVGRGEGGGEGSGSEASDGKLADSLAVHQAVLRQLRRARFEIDPSRYREDREYRAGVKTLKEAVERFGFARVHTALHRSGPEANIKSTSPRVSPRTSKTNKQQLPMSLLEELALESPSSPLPPPQPELPYLSRSAQPLSSNKDVEDNKASKEQEEPEDGDGDYGTAGIGGGWQYSDSSEDVHFGWDELQGVEVELAQVRPLDALSAMIYSGPPFQMHWTLRGHAVFSIALRKAVATCLLMQCRQANAVNANASASAVAGVDAVTNAVAGASSLSGTNNSDAPTQSSVRGPHAAAVLPPALWFCIFEYFGFNYSTPHGATGAGGSFDASSGDAAPNLVGSDAAPLGAGGFRLSNVDEEGAEDCEDAVEHEVNYGDKVLAFFSSAAARAAPRQSEMPPLFNHNNSSSSGGVLREASSSMNFHLSGKPAAVPSHTHAHLNPHASALATTTLPQTLDEGHRRLELTDGGVGSSFSSSTEGHSGGAVDAWSDEARWRSLVVLWGGLAKRCLKASDKNSRALGERLLVSLHCHTLQAGRAPIPLLESSRGDDERLEWLYYAPCACDKCHRAAIHTSRSTAGAAAAAVGPASSVKPVLNLSMANSVAPMVQSSLSTASANTDASATSSAATSGGGGGLSSTANGFLGSGQPRCLDLRAVLASWSVKKRTQSYRSASPMSSASSGTHSSYHPLGRYSPQFGSSLAGPWAHALVGGSGLQGLSQRSNTDAPKAQVSTATMNTPRASQLSHHPVSSERHQAPAVAGAPLHSTGFAPAPAGSASEILPPQVATSPNGQMPEAPNKEPPKPPRMAYL